MVFRPPVLLLQGERKTLYCPYFGPELREEHAMTAPKNPMDRRAFLKTTTLTGASLALSAGLAGNALASDAGKGAAAAGMPTRVLGKTGVSLPILSLGGIDWTTNQSLLRMAYKMGITHWDAAPIYGNGKCEMGLGQYFEKYPEDRKNIFLVTKASRTSEPSAMEGLLTESLELMKTDYIDLYFIHMLSDPDKLTPEVKAWAEQKKKEGKIKFFGFSTHANMADMMMAAAQRGWIDAIMTTYNYQNMYDDDIKRGMDAMAKAGTGFIAMKTQGQGFGGAYAVPQGREGMPARGEGPPQGMQGGAQATPAQAAGKTEDLSALQHFMDKGYTLEQAKLKAVWADERVASLLSKISNLTILKDNVAAAKDGQKLSSLDRKVLERLAENTCSLYCRACMRCESVLSSSARVPDVLRYMMYYNSYGEMYEARELFRRLPRETRSTLATRDYSAAERACPSGIQIGAAMKEAAQLLGS
jgi:predicted aldo/keto reductase-like oxidoreductase